MKRVLFIAYLYPPIANSGTRRSLEFANHLPDSGWEPIVLTVANPLARDCDPSLLDEIRRGTRIERVPLYSDVLANAVAGAFKHLVEPGRLAPGVEWRLRGLWQIPDEVATWRSSAIHQAERIFRETGFDAIYASGWPWTSFLVAAEVARRTRRPYVLDYRDLWKPSGAAWERPKLLQRWLNPRLERKVTRDAAAIVCTTEGSARILTSSLRVRNVIPITNGFEPDDFLATPRVDQTRRRGLIHVAYTGVWRPGYGPDDLYAAIHRLKQYRPECLKFLRVTTAGFAPGRAKEYGIDNTVEELGQVTHTNAIDIMLRSQVLYLPVSKGLHETVSIPGKLFDYIGSGKPILASVPSDSEVARVLRSVGSAICISPGDIESLASALDRLSSGDTTLFSARAPDAATRYERSNLTKKLAAVFDSVQANYRLLSDS